MLMLYLSMVDTDPERELLIELYNSCRGPLYRFAYKYVSNAFDAEDVVHDVFCAAAAGGIKELMQLDDAGRRRFLFVCVRNRALNVLKRKAKIVSAEALAEKGRDIPAEDGEIFTGLAEREAVESAAEAIERLDRKYSDVLWMSIKGLSVDAISEIIGEKPETVRKRLYRAKQLLRREMFPKGSDEQ